MLVITQFLTGCDDQKMVLPKVCEYFPGSVLYHFDKRVLWVQTQVDGISAKTATIIYEDFCQKFENPVGKLRMPLATTLKLDGHRIFVVGFRRGIVAYDIQNGVDPVSKIPRFQILDWQHEPEWFIAHLGYAPEKSQIVVVGQ